MIGAIFRCLIVFALCLLPQTAFGRSAMDVSAPDSAPGISWQTHGQLTFPFEYFKQHIYISVTLDGKPGYIFMLDSGANRNVLNLRTARKLGIQSGKLRQERNVGFGDGPIYTASRQYVDAEMDSIPIASEMSVMDLNQFELHFSHPTDGILGFPFLQRFVVKLDFQRKLLSMFPARQYVYRGLGVRVHLESRKGFVVIPVIIGSSRYVNHQAKVIVDTGSNVTLMLYEHYVHELNLESSLMHARAGKAYGLNGYYAVDLGSIHSLQIGDAEAHNVPVDYMQPGEEIHPGRDNVGSIGNGILQSFQAVIFDVPHRQIILEVKPPQLEPGDVRTETNGP